MFMNMNAKKAEETKLYNASFKKKQRVKVYPRVHNKDKNLVQDWLDSFYDEH